MNTSKILNYENLKKNTNLRQMVRKRVDLNFLNVSLRLQYHFTFSFEKRFILFLR